MIQYARPSYYYNNVYIQRRATKKEDEQQEDQEFMDKLLRKEDALDEEELELERRAR